MDELIPPDKEDSLTPRRCAPPFGPPVCSNQKAPSLIQEKRLDQVLSSYLSETEWLPQELAPSGVIPGLPGFIGPVPPPLWIRVLRDIILLFQLKYSIFNCIYLYLISQYSLRTTKKHEAPAPCRREREGSTAHPSDKRRPSRSMDAAKALPLPSPGL